MAKINSTYSSGYYISPDTDFRKLEEQQAAEKRKLLKRGRDGGDDNDPEVIKANTKRQTFAIPFDLYCDHCNRRIARGAHVYTNRRPTRMKYLNAIRIWELEIRCQYCSGLYYLHTDPETPKETGGYKCVRHCHRAEGDFLALNARNEAAKAQWEKEKEEAETNPLAALERENEASRRIAERNRRIEEDVLARADDATGDEDLLAALRRRRLIAQSGAASAASPFIPGLPNLSICSGGGYTNDGRIPTPTSAAASASAGSAEEDRLTTEEMAAEEEAYRQFEADMEMRWRRAQAESAARETQVLAGASNSGNNSGLLSGVAVGWFLGATDTDRGEAQPESAPATAPDSSKEDSPPTRSLQPGFVSLMTATTAADGGAPPRSARKNKFHVDSNSDGDEDDGGSAPPQASRKPPPLQKHMGRSADKKASLLQSMFDSDDE